MGSSFSQLPLLPNAIAPGLRKRVAREEMSDKLSVLALVARTASHSLFDPALTTFSVAEHRSGLRSR